MAKRTLILGFILSCFVAVLLTNSARISLRAEDGVATKEAKKNTAKESTTAKATDANVPEKVMDVLEGPLADYLAKEDNSYSWKKIRSGKFNKTEYVELILTSQKWHGITWKHRLFIAKPSTMKPNAKHGLLFIEGGFWKDKYEDPNFKEKLPRQAVLLTELAERLAVPVAVVLDVPHQPIFGGLYEDQIIAYTFTKFLKNGSSDWPLLLPMTKSAIKAMDATQEFCKKDWSLDLKTFTVTGASKRGWTTWLVGATDKRATSIAPMVIDTLNMIPQMAHQTVAWGDFSEKIGDYTSRGIMKYLNAPRGKELTNIVDPFVYRKLLKQPKLIIIGTNDRYWPLDALNLYWDQLKGPKHILYVPNNGHGIRDISRLLGGLFALNEQARGGAKMPNLVWKFKELGKSLSLKISSDKKPTKVQIWYTRSKTRDFRKAVWFSKEATLEKDSFTYSAKPPKSGYSAFFGEAVYELNGIPFYLSTNVRILKGVTPTPVETSGGE